MSSFFHLKNKFRKSKKNKKVEKEDENINKNIGPYVITNKIGETIYSKIYLGKSKYTNDEVEIKIISKETLQENLEDLSLLLNHIESLKILKHKNIISLYEIYESPKFFYFVMEYFPKKNLLEKIILKKRLSENEALIIFIQILDALIYMHKMNIAHRNIRTDHILFDKNNRPKLTGFNYSTFYEKNKKVNGAFGSLCYTCPEILNEEEYNPELADVWSLGVVLYVMLCGFLPFSEENDEKNKELIIEGKVEYPKEISNKIKDLLKHMLEVDSSKRFNLQKISKHPWVKKFTDDKSIFVGGINIIEIKYPVDERILNIIDKNFKNFNKNHIKRDLIENKYNQGTGLYKLLLRKIIDMKINTVSDLFCNDFRDYIMNINNYFNKADKNENSKLYKKYIENVNDKLNKIGDYIEEYQRKEDDAVNYFLNIEKLKKSIMIKPPPDTNANNDSLYSDKRVSFFDNINSNNDFKLSRIDNVDIHFIDNMDENNEEQKDEDIDIDLLKQFKEEQSKKNIKNLLKSSRNDKRSINKYYQKSNSQNFENKELGNLINKINNFSPKKSITLESEKIIKDIIKDKEKNDDKANDSLLYSFRNNQSFFNKSIRKSHIDRGSFLEGYLKKNHPENIRRTLLRNSCFSNISEEEDDDNNNRKSDKKLNEKINGDYENEKKMEYGEVTPKNKTKEIRYSLSFMDDDGESEFTESIYLSRNDVKFASEIKDAIRELNAFKKNEKEKVKFRGKEKGNLNINNNKNINPDGLSSISHKKSIFKEKNKNSNFYINNDGSSNITPKKSNLREKSKNKDRSKNTSSNFKDNIKKEKEKKVFFTEFCQDNNDNKYNKVNTDNIDNNDRKENEKNYINNKENKEDYYIEESNTFFLNSNDFSFNEEEATENINRKKSKMNNYRRKNTVDNCFFKNDKLIISKLSNEINNKEIFSISNIENKRNKMFVMKFSLDKFKIKRLNIDNNNNRANINNINIIEKKNNKPKNHHKESLDLLEFSYKEKERNNHNSNNILKYQESILNKSNNNLQNEAIINSSNNSYTSIKRNSSTININTNNNNYILYDNNFIMNNEEEDSIVKMIVRKRDSNKENSLEFSSIQKNGQVKKDNGENIKDNYKKKRKEILKNLSGYLNNENESIKIFENELPDKPKKNRKYLTSTKKKISFGKNVSSAVNKTKPNNLFIISNKDKKNIKSNQEIRNKSLENRTKKHIKSNFSKNNKNSVNKKEKTNKNNLKKSDKKKFQALQNEFLYNPNYYLNTNNYNTVNKFEILPNLLSTKNQNNDKKKKKIRYNTLMNKTNKNVKSQIINTEQKLTYLKNISFYDDKCGKPTNNTKKNKNIKNSNKKSTFCKVKRNESKNKRENNFNKEKTKKKINKNNKNTQSLFLINPIILEQDKITNKIIKLNSSKSKNKEKNTSVNKYNENNNNNIVHRISKLNKKSNKKVIQNMLLKRKEMVKKIRNCKLIMNNLNSDLKCHTAKPSEQNHFPYVDSESIKIINKSPNIKTEDRNESIKTKDSPKEDKKILCDNNNNFIDNTNFITIDSMTIRNQHNNLDNKFNSSNESPKKESACHIDRIFDLNNEMELNNNKNKRNNTLGNDEENYNRKINILKKIILRNTYNNKIVCSSNSSNKDGSDFNDN